MNMTKAPCIIVKMIHIHGSLKGEIQEYTDNVITVGRLTSATLNFPADEPGVSREHARIQREGNQFKLIDMSKFGTSVNGKRINEAVLKNGDVIEFGPGGPKVSFIMEISADSCLPPDAPPCQAAPRRDPLPPAVEKSRDSSGPVYEGDAAEALAPNGGQKGPCSPAVQRTTVPLVIQFGPTIRTYRELPVTVGADSRADFVLRQQGVLDQHAQIFFYQANYWIKDLSGQRLISVNNRPIDLHVQLALDDEIEFCPHGPKMRYLGDGRLAEIEAAVEPPLLKAQKENEIEPARNVEHHNLLSKLVKSLMK